MSYGRFGSMGVKPGQRDRVVEILLRDVQELRNHGCALYLVQTAESAPETVFVSEVWSSPEAHRASLQLPSVQAAIREAMPLLTGEFSATETEVVGGLNFTRGAV